MRVLEKTVFGRSAAESSLLSSIDVAAAAICGTQARGIYNRDFFLFRKNMDKACITVASAHNRMLLSMNASMPAGGGGGGGISVLGSSSSSRVASAEAAAATFPGTSLLLDMDASVAERCQMVARGFQPLQNAMDLKEW